MRITSLEIRDVTDEEEIKSILTDEEIYGRITHDDCPDRKDYIFRDPFESRFIGGYVDGKIIGLVVYHDNKIHVNVLKPYRKVYKRELLRGSLGMIDAPVIFAEIPSLFPQIIVFAESEGFREIDVIKGGFKKNGKSYNTHIMVYEK